MTTLITKMPLFAMAVTISTSVSGAWVTPDISQATVEANVQYNSATGVYAYRYALTNPMQSTAGILGFVVDISRKQSQQNSSDPDLYSDNSIEYNHQSPTSVNVGLSSPVNWDVMLTNYDGASWQSTEEMYNVMPGQLTNGFIITSKSPPGPRLYQLSPEIDQGPGSPYEIYGEACDVEPACPNPFDLDVKGYTIGPVEPADIALIDHTGTLSSNPNDFLRYANPLELKPTLPLGTQSFDLVIHYSQSIDPATFYATLDRQDISSRFTVIPGGYDLVKIPLQPGRNTLQLQVDGPNFDGIKGGRSPITEKTKFVFIVERR